jgi:hypothetical protein
MTQFKMEVAEPWKNLIRSAYKSAVSLSEPKQPDSTEPQPSDSKKDQVYTLNLQWQMQSWLILLDFADFLAVYLPEVWDAVANGAILSDPPSSSRQILYNWLDNASMPAALINALLRPNAKMPEKPADYVQRPTEVSLRAALAAVVVARTGIESTLKLYGDTTTNDPNWPDFHFLLAGLDINYTPTGPYQSLPLLTPDASTDVDPAPSTNANPTFMTANLEAEKLDRLTALIVRALDKQKPTIDAPDPPFALQLSKALKETQGDVGWFVVRYVYMKRECGPLHPPTLSQPTQRFQLASFFDSDAPARPIRISLPMDTTPAGIRKHSKNTAFIISDVLCGQIQRAKGLGLIDLVRSVLPWPLHKDLELGDGGACSLGMICSLSIPIITICALILLIIIVSLLDFIFRWLPYFIICFPVPGLKGKKG